jgi:hypothetical protein
MPDASPLIVTKAPSIVKYHSGPGALMLMRTPGPSFLMSSGVCDSLASLQRSSSFSSANLGHARRISGIARSQASCGIVSLSRLDAGDARDGDHAAVESDLGTERPSPSRTSSRALTQRARVEVQAKHASSSVAALRSLPSLRSVATAAIAWMICVCEAGRRSQGRSADGATELSRSNSSFCEG